MDDHARKDPPIIRRIRPPLLRIHFRAAVQAGRASRVKIDMDSPSGMAAAASMLPYSSLENWPFVPALAALELTERVTRPEPG